MMISSFLSVVSNCFLECEYLSAIVKALKIFTVKARKALPDDSALM